MNLSLVEKLAPRHLENCRTSRYRGDDQTIRLDALQVADQGTIQDLHVFLHTLLAAASDDEEHFLDHVDLKPLPALIDRLRRVGEAAIDDPRVAAAIHDIRGGTMGILSIVLTRYVRTGALRPYSSRSIALSIRDHLKIMRNVLEDLDPPRREQDLAYKPHSLLDLAGAIRAFPGIVGDVPATVVVDCPEDAVIAESCVECGAIDRAAYNLLNNALHHARGASIQVWLIVTDDNLRVAVANDVSELQRRSLENIDAASLFGDFTTTGSGKGLQIVADLVGRAYGIPSAMLTSSQHVGARLLDDVFVSWFHWPLSGA